MAIFRRTAIIYNPRAGRLIRQGPALLPHLEAVLRKAGHNPILTPTTGPRTAAALACRSIAEGADLILAAGGDGTVNEVLNGMIGCPVPLGILPMGTANVLANELRLPKLESLAAVLGDYAPRRVALGRLAAGPEMRHFVLMAGAGLDAHMVYHVNARLKDRWGKLAYWAVGLGLAGKALPEFQAEVDGRAHTCSFALVSRVRNYGGDFEIARGASLLADYFEVVLFQGRNSIRYVKYLLAAAAGRVQRLRGVTVLHARHVTLAHPEDRRVYVQADGEYAGRLPATIELIPNALTLLMPPRYS